MANPNPTPNLQNLRPPWQPGASGNPAGYSRGRRISDAIERRMDELGLDQAFADVAIAMAFGRRELLKRKAIDPETEKETWVVDTPNHVWFRMLQARIDPPAGKLDDMEVLNALSDDDDDYPPPIETCKAAKCPILYGTGTSCPSASVSVESAGQLFQGEPARAGNGQAAPKAAQSLFRAVDLERFHPARYAVQLFAFLQAWLAGLFTGARLRGALVQGVAVAAFLLLHQAIVLDHQRAGGHVAQQGTVAADEQQGLDVQVMGRLVHGQFRRDPVALEAAAPARSRPAAKLAGQVHFSRTLSGASPERPPDRRASSAGSSTRT
jgi:hypothetical protein